VPFTPARLVECVLDPRWVSPPPHGDRAQLTKRAPPSSPRRCGFPGSVSRAQLTETPRLGCLWQEKQHLASSPFGLGGDDDAHVGRVELRPSPQLGPARRQVRGAPSVILSVTCAAWLPPYRAVRRVTEITLRFDSAHRWFVSWQMGHHRPLCGGGGSQTCLGRLGR
jgi:hypothetical protein